MTLERNEFRAPWKGYFFMFIIAARMRAIQRATVTNPMVARTNNAVVIHIGIGIGRSQTSGGPLLGIGGYISKVNFVTDAGGRVTTKPAASLELTRL